jgi:hypothetical protein
MIELVGDASCQTQPCCSTRNTSCSSPATTRCNLCETSACKQAAASLLPLHPLHIDKLCNLVLARLLFLDVRTYASKERRLLSGPDQGLRRSPWCVVGFHASPKKVWKRGLHTRLTNAHKEIEMICKVAAKSQQW